MARETSTNLEKEGDNDSGKPLQILSAVQTKFQLIYTLTESRN